MAMSLNNGGDEITLLDGGNVVRDGFEYMNSSESVARLEPIIEIHKC
jgi:hypothetical protein